MFQFLAQIREECSFMNILKFRSVKFHYLIISAWGRKNKENEKKGAQKKCTKTEIKSPGGKVNQKGQMECATQTE